MIKMKSILSLYRIFQSDFSVINKVGFPQFSRAVHAQIVTGKFACIIDANSFDIVGGLFSDNDLSSLIERQNSHSAMRK